jgi:hypothetical protein
MIHLSQACSLWPCNHFDYPQPAPEGCIVNSIMLQENIRHLGNDLKKQWCQLWHHTVIWSESENEGLEERKHGGAVVLWVWTTESTVRRLHCRSKGRRTSAHTSRYLF